MQEALIASYHKSITKDKIKLAALLAAIITLLSIIIIANIMADILNPKNITTKYFYITSFVIGKGLGSYIGLKWWTKKN